MGQPIIYLYEKMKEAHLETIQQLAPTYRIIDATREYQPFNEEDIEISLGWNKELGQRLLNSPNSHLNWVQSISAGIDRFDLQLFSEKHILLSNASGIHSISIAEHVLGVLLVESRGIASAIKDQEKHQWSGKNKTYNQLSGQKMLVVGTGNIGQQLAVFAKGLGLQVYGINTSGHVTNGFIECYSYKNLPRILQEMDIVVNILPLTAATKHLYNKQLFAVMKPGTTFVNVGRGPSVKTEDLIDALQTGQLRFAALDVFEEEPLPADSPLWAMEQVLLTPHISGLTPGFKEKLLAIFTQNLRSYLTDGKLTKNQVSLEKGY